MSSRRQKREEAPSTEANRGGRKPRSFVLRLTVGQFFRTMGTMFWLDVLIAALFLAFVLIGLEGAAYRYWDSGAPLPDSAEAIRRTGEPEGVELDLRLAERIEAVPDSMRGFGMQQMEEQNPALFNWQVKPLYTISYPNEDGKTHTRIAFDLSGTAYLAAWGFVVLLAGEFLLLISSTRGFRRSARHTLAPIQQLAEAAESISNERAAPRRQVRPEKENKDRKNREAELELSGAIDTLNQITAKRLDTRISIGDKRMELQGLASAINGMLDRLDAAYSSQLRFVSDASHELRTPIAVIQGYANLLDRWGKEDPEALQESIDAIKAEAEGMKALVEQLLFLARSDNNSIVIEMEAVDLSALCEDVARDAQVIDQAHEYATDIPPMLFVEGDSGLLKQALRIFVDNAIKYTPPGGRIGIAVRSEAGCAKVSVTDSGIGIPAEDVPHVFERFFRSDESRARATGGTGLGLSIAKWTAQRHGGYLEVVSRQDVGTRFTMALPEAAVETEAEEQAEVI